MDEQTWLFRLTLFFANQVGPSLMRRMLQYSKTAEMVLTETKKVLTTVPGISNGIYDNIHKASAMLRAERELRLMQKHGITPLFFNEKNYPRRFNEDPLCSPIVFYRGTASLNLQKHVGIVGTRIPTSRGIQWCKNLVSDIKSMEVQVISGLAYGIDVHAHRECIRHKISNIAVLAHGLDQIYPPDHISESRFLEKKGGLLSMFPCGGKPDRENFPKRNRLIAALSDALIVVETQLQGGSMITALLANELNKDVFALPGNVTDKKSIGCNHLIKTHRAALIESASDLAYVMNWNQVKSKQLKLIPTLPENQKLLYELLLSKPVIHADELLLRSKLSSGELAGALLSLELLTLISQLPGNRYKVN